MTCEDKTSNTSQGQGQHPKIRIVCGAIGGFVRMVCKERCDLLPEGPGLSVRHVTFRVDVGAISAMLVW